MKLKLKLKELFKTKKQKRKEKLLKEFQEGKYLKIGGEVNSVING